MTLRDASALVLTALIAVAICATTLAPPSGLPAVPGSDKLHHVLAFALLALPTALLSPKQLLGILPLAAALGAMIELVQPFVGRSAEMADWQADIAGLAIGTVLGLTLHGSTRLAVRARAARNRNHESQSQRVWNQRA